MRLSYTKADSLPLRQDGAGGEGAEDQVPLGSALEGEGRGFNTGRTGRRSLVASWWIAGPG